jgi:acyl carrier protein
MSADLLEKVKEIIVDQLGADADAVKPEAAFIDDLGADSLDVVELVMAMEEAFDISIPVNVMAEVRTVGELAGAVQALLN